MPSPSARRHTARANDAELASALKLWVVLSRAHTAVTRHAHADIASHGLTAGEFGILEALYHRGPLLLGELQRKILVTSGGVTYLVDRLAEKGLVERRDCAEDARARYAALTRQGEALIGSIFPEHARCIARAVAGLTRAERVEATALLRRLGRTAEELPLQPETANDPAAARDRIGGRRPRARSGTRKGD